MISPSVHLPIPVSRSGVMFVAYDSKGRLWAAELIAAGQRNTLHRTAPRRVAIAATANAFDKILPRTTRS